VAQNFKVKLLAPRFTARLASCFDNAARFLCIAEVSGIRELTRVGFSLASERTSQPLGLWLYASPVSILDKASAVDSRPGTNKRRIGEQDSIFYKGRSDSSLRDCAGIETGMTLICSCALLGCMVMVIAICSGAERNDSLVTLRPLYMKRIAAEAVIDMESQK
jgi:hypothetical protein